MSQPDPQPQAEAAPKMTLAEFKQAVCKKLTAIFSSPLMEERLMKMVGGDASRLAKNLTAFLAVLTEDKGSGRGNDKKYLVECTISSLTMCFLESVNMRLPFDSRNLISMVIYENNGILEAELDISYKGFINALNRHYSNAFVDAKIVFEGDDFTCEEHEQSATYTLKAKDPFRNLDKELTGLKGGFCFFSYTTANGAPVSRIVRVSKEAIQTIRSKAKTRNVWDEFTDQQVIKSIIRRGTKIPFAAIDMDVDIEEVANRHFVLDRPASQEKLANLMKAQEEVVHGKPKQEDAPKAADKPSDQGASPAAASDAESDTGATIAAAEPDPAPSEASADAPADLEEGKAEISDADFEEVAAPPHTEPQKVAPEAEAWDGKTLFLGDGKTTSKDFENAAAALEYLKAVIGKRNHKASRKAIIDANPLLIAALIKSGQGAAIQELHKLADAGA